MLDSPNPRLLALLICDEVRRDPKHPNVLSLDRVHTEVIPPALPDEFAGELYCKFIGVEGPYTMTLEIIGPTGEDLGRASVIETAQSRHVAIHQPIKDVIFELSSAGLYEFRFSLNGQLVGSEYLVVHEPPA